MIFWIRRLFYRHPYTKYRPRWCNHPPFQGANYCWGLALDVDNGGSTPMNERCKGCDLDGRKNG